MEMKEILELVRDMDENVSSQAFSTKGNTLHVTLTQREDGVDIDLTEASAGKKKILHKGMKESTFRQKLDEFMKEQAADDCLSVACLVGEEKQKGGLYRLKYFLVPILGYDIQENGVNFESIERDVTSEEYQIAKETSMAFYHEVTGVLYPIQKSALHSIGRYMDAVASYKVAAEIPLGNALLLAERMADDPKKIKLAFMDYDSLFKPVISVGAEKTAMGSFTSMVEEFFDQMAQIGVYQVSAWDITVERVSITVRFLMEDYSVTFFTSNMPGESNRIRVTQDIAGKSVVFAEGSAYSTTNFSVKDLVNKTMLEYEKSVEHFQKLLADQDVKDFRLTPEEETRMVNCLGQRRFNALNLQYRGNAFDAITALVADTYTELPPKQQKQRDETYMDIIRRLVS